VGERGITDIVTATYNYSYKLTPMCTLMGHLGAIIAIYCDAFCFSHLRIPTFVPGVQGKELQQFIPIGGEDIRTNTFNDS
jgi:hypothetical protein